MTSKGIIRLYFCKYTRGKSVTVNSEENVNMLREFLQPDLQQSTRVQFQQLDAARLSYYTNAQGNVP